MGPYNQPQRLKKLDGRTKISKLAVETRLALIDHLGGAPSATQLATIERIVWLTVKCALLDQRILAGTDTEYDSKTYLAWSNSLRRALRDLGTAPAAPPPPSLATILSEIADQRKAAAQ